jgi:hypothetical protein
MEKNSLLNKFCWENWICEYTKLKLDCIFCPVQVSTQLILEDLNIRSETLKLVQESEGNTLELIGIGNELLSGTHVAQQVRESIDKWEQRN